MMDLGPLSEMRPAFRAGERPAFSGISGGRTSALMAALHDERVTLHFENTGREHPRTLDFLSELECALGRQITWLEYRPPAVKGARPRDGRFAVVNHKTADRSGGPFEMLMEALADYRATKGKGPIAPWARGRLCTAYLKHRVHATWVRSLGVEAFDSFIGLRADEPDRVTDLLARSTRAVTHRVPLFDVGLKKRDVAEFWSAQSFDLRLDDAQGNCSGCFLKDQTDLARVLMDPETDAGWWEEMEARYPMFGGARFAGYRRLREEGPARLNIESALRSGSQPENDGSMAPERFRLVVIQERKRIKGQLPSFSCSCEGAEGMAAADEDLEEQLLLAFPSSEMAPPPREGEG